MTAYGAKAARLHLRYIERDGVERDGSRGVLYGPEGQVDRASFECAREGEKHQFRLVVSPDDAQELDLTRFVRAWVAHIERDLHRRLEWAAVNHYDTDHPHAHVVIRGVDRRGREVRMDRGYVGHGLRAQAQAIATDELGPRSRLEIETSRAAEVVRDRVTSLDRALARRERAGVVEVRGPAAAGRGLDKSLLLGRLEHLVDLRLAERTSKTTYALAAGWQERLRELGERGDILKAMHRAVGGDPSRYRLGLDAGAAPGQWRLGRIAEKGVDDTGAGRFYAVVETPDARVYRVPIDAHVAEGLRRGATVAFGPAAAKEGKTGSPIAVHSFPLTLEAQATHAGPVWLDRVDRGGLAPYGLGADVRRAIERRDDALRRWGIDPAASDRGTRLRAIEAAAVGQEIARRTGRVWAATAPQRMQGRVEVVEGNGGGRYAVIGDLRQVVAVPATRALRELAGKEVSLERDARGRLRVRALKRER